MWIVLNVVGIYILYANKIYKNPKHSVVYEVDEYWRNMISENKMPSEKKAGISAWISFFIILIGLLLFSIKYPVTNIQVADFSLSFPALQLLLVIFIIISVWLLLKKSVQLYILHIMLFTILILIIGVLGFGWYIKEIATLFFAMGIMGGIAASYRPNELTKHFLDGAKDIFSAALIVGLANGIIIILQEGGIIDTLLYSLSGMFSGDKYSAASGMYLVQTAINLILPSGSAKAALTMPLMAPFSDLIGLSRQASVVAFQLGDGITNMITPVSGVLLGVLSTAKSLMKDG